jgi:Non-classical export protein 1
VSFKLTAFRWIDPLFGIGVGVFAFYLSERNQPKPPGHSFLELSQKRITKSYNYWIKGDASIGPAGEKPPGRNNGLW